MICMEGVASPPLPVPVPYRVIAKKVTVRSDASLSSEKVGSLLQDQLVDCVQQQRLGGKTRCRVFLGAREGYGWISAEGREGAPLIERHSEPGGAASPAGVAGGAEGRGARSEGSAQARGAASPFSNLMRWRQASHSQLEYAFDALYHATRQAS